MKPYLGVQDAVDDAQTKGIIQNQTQRQEMLYKCSVNSVGQTHYQILM